jgi:putative ABC transport system permease protein
MDGIVTEVVLKTENGYDPAGIAADMKRTLSGYALDINTWEEIEHNIRRMLANHDLLAMVVSVILFVIVFSTVMNTMLMVVLERTNEIGTLTAVGFKRLHILSLFLVEGGLKGVMGGVIGIVVGTAAVSALKSAGIPFRMPGGTGAIYMIRPEVDSSVIILALVFAVGAALLGSLFPADRASRMDPVEALRSV